MLLYNGLVSKFDALYNKYHSNGDAFNMAHLMRLQLSIHTLYEGNLGDRWLRLIRKANYDNERTNQRRWRIRKYVRGMLDTFGDDVYLVSLTFDDNSLAFLSVETRRRYVREYLNSTCPDYFACIDFGKKSGREHYHAIAVFPSDLVSFVSNRGKTFFKPLIEWGYGFMSIRKVNSSRKDVFKSCGYAFKASNYAFKNCDSEHKPFHKRGVKHWTIVRDDWDVRRCPF